MQPRLDLYRAERARCFLYKADTSLDEATLARLPELRREHATAASSLVWELVTAHAGTRPRHVAALAGGTFHCLFRAEIAEGQALIVKTTLPSVPVPSGGMLLEAGAQRWSNVRVHLVDTSRARAPFDYLIADAAPGSALATLPAAERVETLRALGAKLEQVHGVAVRGAGPLDPETIAGDEPRGLLADWHAFLSLRLDEHARFCVAAEVGSAASFDRILAALRRAFEAIVAPPMRLLHGDLSNQNVFTAGGEITALIDWEDALGGDPVFDLAGFGTFVGNHELLPQVLVGQAGVRPGDFWLRYWAYYLRIMLAKTVHRRRFGYYQSDRIPAFERLHHALVQLEQMIV